MTTKTVPFNADGATKLPNNKPVVYRIKTEGNTTNYVGVAQRGRVQERIQEHIHDAQIPGPCHRPHQCGTVSGGKVNRFRSLLTRL